MIEVSSVHPCFRTLLCMLALASAGLAQDAPSTPVGDRTTGFLLPPGLLDTLRSENGKADPGIRAAALAVTLPTTLLEACARELDRAVLAGFEAGRASGIGGFVEHGTFRPSVRDSETWIYENEPSNALCYETPDGTRTTYTFHRVRGDLRQGGKHFLTGSHAIEVTLRRGEDELRLHSTFLPGRSSYRRERSGTSRGRMTIDGERVTFDLAIRGWNHFENDRTGFESREAFEYTGTIERTDVTYQVDESWELHSVSASGTGPPNGTFFPGSRAGSIASLVKRRIRSRYVLDSKEHAFRDAIVTTETRDGRPNERSGNWMAHGVLVANEEPAARLRMTSWKAKYRFDRMPVTAGHWRLVLMFADGREVVLRRWATR